MNSPLTRFRGTVGLGTWIFGGRPPERSPLPANVTGALFSAMGDLDVSWLDTAGVYGLGTVEQAIGAYYGSGTRPWTLTKCGIDWSHEGEPVVSISHRSDPESILRQVNESCERLGVEVLDGLLIHWPDAFGCPIEESWEQVIYLKSIGRIATCGVSNFSAEQVGRLNRIAPVDINQFAWTSPDAPELLEVSDKVGALPMVFGVLKPYLARMATEPETRRAIRALALAHSVAEAALLLRVALIEAPDAAVVLGASSVEQFTSALAGQHLELSPQETAELKSAFALGPAS